MYNGSGPVVFFSLFRTDNPYSSISLSMAREMAKHHRVLYVNHPYSWKDVVSGLINGDQALKKRLVKTLFWQNCYETLPSIPHNFIAVQPPVTLPINWLPAGRVYDALQRLNNRIVLRSIRQATKKFNVRNYLYINCYNPFYAAWLPQEMGAKTTVYHCIDDLSQVPYTARHALRLENEACQKTDLTLVTSTNLYQLKVPIAKRISTFFNAADVGVFQQVLQQKFPWPKELAGRQGKVIGFVGNMDAQRIDYPLLKKIALAYPNHTLLLVGPVNSPEPAQIGLDQLPNVLFVGSRPLHELPPLLQHMDVVLIPFQCNTLTESIYPLKINEYLAAGKAVVSSDFSTDIRSFAPVIYLAGDHDDFTQKIAAALSENDPQLLAERVKTAQNNTWEKRVQQLWEMLDSLPKSP
jgi:glycosyltransferase involved in cell wall biosynthesis